MADTIDHRTPRKWSDEAVDQVLGNLLRGGVLLAAAVVLAGGILYLVRHGSEPAGYSVFKGEPADLRSIGPIIRDALVPHGRGIIQFGVLLLIATPIARVIFSVIAFALQRDRTYVVVTLIVLAVLLYSLIGDRV
jgi:uncharacterized membrane protein